MWVLPHATYNQIFGQANVKFHFEPGNKALLQHEQKNSTWRTRDKSRRTPFYQCFFLLFCVILLLKWIGRIMLQKQQIWRQRWMLCYEGKRKDTHKHTHMYTHAYTQTHTKETQTHTPSHEHAHVHANTNTNTHTYTHTQTQAHTHAHANTSTHISMQRKREK